MRSNLDGSQMETLVDTSDGDPRPGPNARKWCVGIAVHADGGKIYWTQKGPDKGGQGRLFRANISIPQGQTAANRKDIELREACEQCHASEVKSWEASHHAQAMQHATESSVHGDFNDAHFVYGDIATTFYRKDGKFMVRTDGPDGALQDYEAKFTFGVSPLEQYLLELPGGRLQALTIAWDSRPKADGGQRWFHLHPNETIKAGDPLHWTGLQQNWNFECAECHSTNLRRNYDPVSGTYKTSYSEINVSCESCHGPGSMHVSWARKDTGWQSLDATKALPRPSMSDGTCPGRSTRRPATAHAARRGGRPMRSRLARIATRGADRSGPTCRPARR